MKETHTIVQGRTLHNIGKGRETCDKNKKKFSKNIHQRDETFPFKITIKIHTEK